VPIRKALRAVGAPIPFSTVRSRRWSGVGARCGVGSMRVLVTGGRDFSSYEDRMWLYAGLSLLHSMSPMTEVIEGGAHGFDHHAMNWALWRQACGDQDGP
jgi:hypothetical protein